MPELIWQTIKLQKKQEEKTSSPQANINKWKQMDIFIFYNYE